jgi:hypothetical protein
LQSQQQPVQVSGHHSNPSTASNPIFLHRKLSTISSKDRDSKEDANSPDSAKHEVVFSATADVIATNDNMATSPMT